MNGVELWRRYRLYVCAVPTIGLQLDISRMVFDEAYLERMTKPMSRALAAMDEVKPYPPRRS